MTTPEDANTVAGGSPVERMVRRSAPKRDSFALWGNLLTALSGAVAFVARPGWLPAVVSLVTIVLAALILYEDRITAYLAARSDDESA